MAEDVQGDVPEDAWQYWKAEGPDTERGYYYDIIDAIQGYPARTAQLFNVTDVCTDWRDP